MNLIILFCFGTMDYRSLPDRKFFEGVRCVNQLSQCERDGHNRGYSVSAAREMCLAAAMKERQR